MTLHGRIRASPLAIDMLLAIGALLLSLNGPIGMSATDAAAFTRRPDALNIVLIGLTTLPIAFRRLSPVPVFAVVVAAWITDRLLDYPTTLSFVAVILVFHSVGTELPRRRSLVIGGGTAAFITVFTAVGAATLKSIPAAAPVSTLITTLVPLVLGREVHERRLRMEDLEARAARAEHEQRERARLAVTEERARIARELHDVVAHQMTVVVLQADGARRIADGGDPRVRDALDTIHDAGHAAQKEMRRMVGLLRTPTDPEPDLAPLPRLADVATLVAQVRSTDVPVELEVSGDVRPLADGTELSLYRLVQESLTNAVRHGGPDVRARVRIVYGDEHVDLLIEDDGPGATTPDGDGTGHGLVGMRERVAVLGGSFAAGPLPEGGYRVHATVPVGSDA